MYRSWRYSIGYILFILGIGVLQAQTTSVSNFYALRPLVFNSAYAGLTDGFSASLHFIGPRAHVPQAPLTTALYLNQPLPSNVGVGLQAMFDQRGIFRTSRIHGAASYRVLFSDIETHQLNFGLNGGVNWTQIDMSAFQSDNQTDRSDPRLVAQSQAQSEIQFGLSLLYQWKGMSLAFASPLLLSFTSNASLTSAWKRSLTYMLSYAFPVSEDIQFKPMGIGYGLSKTFFVYDIGGILLWKNQYGLQLAYRGSGAVLSVLSAQMSMIELGYALEMPIGNYKALVGTSHSVMLRFLWKEQKRARRRRGRRR